MKTYGVGSLVLVRLHDGRTFQAQVKQIVDSVAGRKVHIFAHAMALKVRAEQIVKVLE
jgi:hypothetical protein